MTLPKNRTSRKQQRRERAIERILNTYHGEPDPTNTAHEPGRNAQLDLITLKNTRSNMQADEHKPMRTKKDHSNRAGLRRNR